MVTTWWLQLQASISSTFKRRRRVGFLSLTVLFYKEPETDFYLGFIYQNHDTWPSCDFQRSWERVCLTGHIRVLNKIEGMLTTKKGVRVSAFIANRACHVLHQTRLFAIATHHIYYCQNPFSVILLSLEIQKYSDTFVSAFCRMQITPALNGQEILVGLSVFWQTHSQIVLVFPLLSYLIRHS